MDQRVHHLQARVAALTAALAAAEERARLGGSEAVQAAEDRGRAAERLMRSVMESLEGRICVLGSDGTVLETNRGWGEDLDRLGVPAGGVGSNFFTLTRGLGLGDDAVATLHEVVMRTVLGERQQNVAKLAWAWGGRDEHVIVRVSTITDHDQARAVVRIIDITKNQTTKARLAEVTQRAQLLALVAEHTDNSVVIYDPDGAIEWVNDAFCRLTGFALEEVVGRRRVELWQGPFTRTPTFARLGAALAAGEAVDVEMPAQTKDGRTYWTQVEIQPVLVDGRIAQFVGVERDVTLRRTAEEQLRASNARANAMADRLADDKALLAAVLAAIPHLVYWKDAELRYQGVNQAFLSLRGLDDAAEQVEERLEGELELQDTLSGLLPRLEAEVLATGRPQSDHRVTLAVPDDPSAQPRELLLSVLPHGDVGRREAGGLDPGAGGVIGVAADVTHLSRLERQLAQASRLESIGQLAAGIAHEINTPVQYVSDNTRFVADAVAGVLAALRGVEGWLTAGAAAGQAGSRAEELARTRSMVSALDLDFLEAEIPSALAQSQEGLDRVAEIVRAMKDFSHPGAERAGVDLNHAVESTVQVCRNEWKYVAEVILDLQPDLERVPCYEGELKQMLLNLLVNAAQAIGEQRQDTPAAGLGRITVGTRTVEDRVRITVADDGPGMPESVRQRVFDPFFTTKDVGRGTGQGLSMAYATVQKHGGTITVASAPGHGATFTIDLPLAVPPTA